MATEPLQQAESALAELAEQFEHWRRSRATAQERIPPAWWDQAVILTTLLPRSQVAKRLRLSPTDLKRQCLARQGSLGVEVTSPDPGFIEVTPPVFGTAAAPSATLTRSNARLGRGCGCPIKRHRSCRRCCGPFWGRRDVATDTPKSDLSRPGAGGFSQGH